ncbi:MAG: CGNR zinc finger domain-containing protein [Actinomycetota bacterium]
MLVASSQQSEIRITLEVLTEITNGIDGVDGAPLDLRDLLHHNGFSRAEKASAASFDRLGARLRELVPLVRALPDLTMDEAMAQVNEHLTELPIAPSIVDHGGVGPHLHWTPSTARFDDQVMADLLMALAHELCDNETIRFGRCGASDCDDVFYDATRNRSRRFCADPRCASRTHTADHRARQRDQG